MPTVVLASNARSRWWTASGVLAALLTALLVAGMLASAAWSWSDAHAPVEQVPEGTGIVVGAIMAVMLGAVAILSGVGAALIWRRRRTGLVIHVVLGSMGALLALQVIATTAMLSHATIAGTPDRAPVVAADYLSGGALLLGALLFALVPAITLRVDRPAAAPALGHPEVR